MWVLGTRGDWVQTGASTQVQGVLKWSDAIQFMCTKLTDSGRPVK